MEVLIIVPYNEIYPPTNGGMQRCFHIIHQLAKYFELTVIINQDKESFLTSISAYPEIANCKIYSTKDTASVKDLLNFLPHRFQNAIRYRWYKKQLNAKADGLFLQYYPVLIELLAKNKYDIIVLENLATINAVSIIRRYDKKVRIVYDAHNVDTHLAKVAVEKWEMKREDAVSIERNERNFYATVNDVIACSKDDLDELKQMNGGRLKGIVVPNGVNLFEKLYNEGVKKEHPEYILFCGTLSSVANSEGLLWFYNHCWNTIKQPFPKLKLLVVGSGQPGPELAALQNDIAVEFSGTVADVKAWYNKASIALVPLLSGSGTRLKIFEAMSMGLPVISTSKGAEGINYTNGKDILIADEKNAFSIAVIDLLNDAVKRNALATSAREMVAINYDWDVIGNSLHSFLTS